MFDAIALGLSNGEISATLHLSPATVKTHMALVVSPMRRRAATLAVTSGLAVSERRDMEAVVLSLRSIQVGGAQGA